MTPGPEHAAILQAVDFPLESRNVGFAAVNNIERRVLRNCLVQGALFSPQFFFNDDEPFAIPLTLCCSADRRETRIIRDRTRFLAGATRAA